MRGYRTNRASLCLYKPIQMLVCILVFAQFPLAEARLGLSKSHSSSSSEGNENNPTTTNQTPTSSSIESKIKEETEKLATRVADLFTCVPGKADNEFSTQSWYIMNAFMAWNNDLARSTLSNNLSFSAENKKLFIQTALERLKDRRDGFEKDEKIKAYILSLADTTEILFKNALDEKRVVYDKSTDISELMTKSHSTNQENVFKKLKAAHTEHVGFLENHDCTGLKPGFWQTPKFDFPNTTSSIDKVSKAKSTERPQASVAPRAAPHGVSERPARVEKEITNRNQYFNEIDSKYPRSSKIAAKLPISSYASRKENGYHTYYRGNDYLYGRPHIIGNILKASRLLSEQGIYMGVGDINRKPSDDSYYSQTPGHKTHTEGRAADFRLVDKNGNGTESPCTVDDTSCYSREKTYLMIKALIDVDPRNISAIHINDSTLRGMLERYLISAYGYSKSDADNKVTYCVHHDNHVHFHWIK